MGVTVRELCPNWFALTVRHRHERHAQELLGAQDFETLVPSYRVRRQWSDRTKEIQLPLFAGYVFCRFPWEEKTRVLRTPGVVSVVNFAGSPAPLASEEIATLLQAVDSGLPLAPWAQWRRGDRVRIERGPLKGVEGHLLADAGAWRLVVGVELLRRAVAVELTPDMVAPLAGAATAGNMRRIA